MSESIKDNLSELTSRLMKDYKSHAVRKEAEYKATGKVVYDEFYPKYSKPIIDEIECLRILLRGPQPVIVCPARGIKGMRMHRVYIKPLEEGRLLFLSSFKESQRRNTVETAMERNRFVAAIADTVFVAHASPNSKTERFCHEVLSWGKPLYTLESDAIDLRKSNAILDHREMPIN